MTARDPSVLEREIASWLATIAADTADTLVQAPRLTIVPAAAPPSTAGGRALALLEELAGLPPGSSGQVRQGDTIGEGGMGVIRLAEQVALGRTVAVKSLKPDKRDRRAALDLLREAWVTGAVEHPNVVPIHTIGLDDDGSPLIVMKRIEGRSWHDLLDDPDTVAARFGATDLLAWNLGILLQVLNAVRFAHSRGILHRDLKPANVMIGEFGEVYLLDWGIAVSLRDDGSGRLPLASAVDEVAGTPCYMAPEMLGREGGPPLSERTDVYLAGAVLYELITFRPPHDGPSAAAVVASIVISEPELPAGIPAELERICRRAMAADPAERFESIEALQHALHRYLEHRGSTRLSDRARERLDELLAGLAAPHADPAHQREQIYRLFGACRFGFLEALAAWPDNQDARAGLLRAAVAVAEYELADDPRAALTLLGEVDGAPPELIERARAAAQARALHQADLERLRQQYDVAIGTRTRMFLSFFLGILFTGIPVLGAAFPGAMHLDSHGRQLGWSLGFLALVILLGVWARDSMRKTAINRRAFAAIVYLFVAQAILVAGARSLGVDPVQTQVLWIFLWMVSAAMSAIGIDRGLVPTAIGYVVAFGLAARWPEHRLWAMALGNGIFTINAVIVWRPKNLWPTDEELAMIRKRRR